MTLPAPVESRHHPATGIRSALTPLIRAGCGAGDSHLDAGMDHNLRDFATRTAAWSSQDPASVASFFAEDGSLTINEDTPSVGRDAITEAARGFMIAFPDMVVAMESLHVEDAGIGYHRTLTGTNTGPGGTGNAVRVSGYEEWTRGADGLITHTLGHFDQAEYRRQLAQEVVDAR